LSFFALYRELAREGLGEAADVACGSGADNAALLAACPGGHIGALDAQAHFISEASARVAGDKRVSLRVGGMGQIGGPYDFI